MRKFIFIPLAVAFLLVPFIVVGTVLRKSPYQEGNCEVYGLSINNESCNATVKFLYVTSKKTQIFVYSGPCVKMSGVIPCWTDTKQVWLTQPQIFEWWHIFIAALSLVLFMVMLCAFYWLNNPKKLYEMF